MGTNGQEIILMKELADADDIFVRDLVCRVDFVNVFRNFQRRHAQGIVFGRRFHEHLEEIFVVVVGVLKFLIGFLDALFLIGFIQNVHCHFYGVSQVNLDLSLLCSEELIIYLILIIDSRVKSFAPLLFKCEASLKRVASSIYLLLDE